MIRPERVHLETQDSTGQNRVPGMVERLVYLGNSVQVIVHLAVGTTIQALVQNVGTEIPWKQGTPVQAHLPADALRVLEDTGAALAPARRGRRPRASGRDQRPRVRPRVPPRQRCWSAASSRRREMMRRWMSDVPSSISSSFASRIHFSTGYSRE